jgi:hypothetical protein
MNNSITNKPIYKKPEADRDWADAYRHTYEKARLAPHAESTDFCPDTFNDTSCLRIERYNRNIDPDKDEVNNPYLVKKNDEGELEFVEKLKTLNRANLLKGEYYELEPDCSNGAPETKEELFENGTLTRLGAPAYRHVENHERPQNGNYSNETFDDKIAVTLGAEILAVTEDCGSIREVVDDVFIHPPLYMGYSTRHNHQENLSEWTDVRLSSDKKDWKVEVEPEELMNNVNDTSTGPDYRPEKMDFSNIPNGTEYVHPDKESTERECISKTLYKASYTTPDTIDGHDVNIIDRTGELLIDEDGKQKAGRNNPVLMELNEETGKYKAVEDVDTMGRVHRDDMPEKYAETLEPAHSVDLDRELEKDEVRPLGVFTSEYIGEEDEKEFKFDFTEISEHDKGRYDIPAGIDTELSLGAEFLVDQAESEERKPGLLFEMSECYNSGHFGKTEDGELKHKSAPFTSLNIQETLKKFNTNPCYWHVNEKPEEALVFEKGFWEKYKDASPDDMIRVKPLDSEGDERTSENDPKLRANDDISVGNAKAYYKDVMHSVNTVLAVASDFQGDLPANELIDGVNKAKEMDDALLSDEHKEKIQALIDFNEQEAKNEPVKEEGKLNFREKLERYDAITFDETSGNFARTIRSAYPFSIAPGGHLAHMLQPVHTEHEDQFSDDIREVIDVMRFDGKALNGESDNMERINPGNLESIDELDVESLNNLKFFSHGINPNGWATDCYKFDNNEPGKMKFDYLNLEDQPFQLDNLGEVSKEKAIFAELDTDDGSLRVTQMSECEDSRVQEWITAGDMGR